MVMGPTPAMAPLSHRKLLPSTRPSATERSPSLKPRSITRRKISTFSVMDIAPFLDFSQCGTEREKPHLPGGQFSENSRLSGWITTGRRSVLDSLCLDTLAELGGASAADASIPHFSRLPTFEASRIGTRSDAPPDSRVFVPCSSHRAASGARISSTRRP